MARTRTTVMVAQPRATAGRRWCAVRGLGFGVLLEQALPLVLELGEVIGDQGQRERVLVRVDAGLWGQVLGRCGEWPALPGMACDHALRLFLAAPTLDGVPFDL